MNSQTCKPKNCIVVGMSYGFYETSTDFQQQIGFSTDQMLESGFNNDPKIGRIEAFIEASKTMEAKYFWSHLLKYWLRYCAIIFIGCAIMLAVIKTPKQDA